MDMKKTQSVWIVVIGVAGIMAVAVALAVFSKPAPLDALAYCLKEKGAVFYGAYWCAHCKNQKKMFGRSAKKLPYVECSLSNSKEQTKECIDKKIKGYPTWEFADGTREEGELSLERLAIKTGCAIPDSGQIQ